jgi:CsoR family transcriptional regulator, copper-sensing transcriptional repressor
MRYTYPVQIKAEIREEVLNRLRRIEGQVRGIQRLVEQGAECHKISGQVKAARTALDAAGKLVLGCHLAEALTTEKITEREAIEMIVKF